MTPYLFSLALALSLLLLGGAVPGGTWLLTPGASAWLVLLAYLGPRGPRALFQLADGNAAPLSRLFGARFGAGARALLLLGLPIWGLQCAAGLGTAPVAPLLRTHQPVAAAATTFRAAVAPIRVWFEADEPGKTDGPGAVTIQTINTSRTLRGQAHDGPLGAAFPAASVGWAWADADLLPDLVVTVAPENGHSHEYRTFYIPLTDKTVAEQSSLARHLWTGFLLAYPVLGLSALAFLAARLLYRLGRLLLGLRFSNR